MAEVVLLLYYVEAAHLNLEARKKVTCPRQESAPHWHLCRAVWNPLTRLSYGPLLLGGRDIVVVTGLNRSLGRGALTSPQWGRTERKNQRRWDLNFPIPGYGRDLSLRPPGTEATLEHPRPL